MMVTASFKNKEVPRSIINYWTFGNLKLWSLLWCLVKLFSFLYIYFKITTQQQNWLLRHNCGCPAPSPLLRFLFTRSFLDVQRCQYVQGGIRPSEMPIHIMITNDVPCWTAYAQPLKQAVWLWSGAWNLICGTWRLATLAAFCSVGFGWRRRNPTSEHRLSLRPRPWLSKPVNKYISGDFPGI